MRQEDSIEHPPSDRQIVSLLKALGDANIKTVGINGVVRERINTLAQTTNLDKQALRAIAREIAKPEQRRNDFLRKCDYYRDVARAAGLYGDEHVSDMLDGELGLRPMFEDGEVVLPGADAQGDYKPVA